MATKDIKAGPTKRFFVKMLTRDIELADAILDLLDNCVDGIIRELKSETGSSETGPKLHTTDIGPRSSHARITLRYGTIAEAFPKRSPKNTHSCWDGRTWNAIPTSRPSGCMASA